MKNWLVSALGDLKYVLEDKSSELKNSPRMSWMLENIVESPETLGIVEILQKRKGRLADLLGQSDNPLELGNQAHMQECSVRTTVKNTHFYMILITVP